MRMSERDSSPTVRINVLGDVFSIYRLCMWHVCMDASIKKYLRGILATNAYVAVNNCIFFIKPHLLNHRFMPDKIQQKELFLIPFMYWILLDLCKTHKRMRKALLNLLVGSFKEMFPETCLAAGASASLVRDYIEVQLLMVCCRELRHDIIYKYQNVCQIKPDATPAYVPRKCQINSNTV